MLVVIPARAGSKRLPNKALRPFGPQGHPLIAYTIASARETGADVLVATEDGAIRDCARHYGSGVWMRPLHTATDDAADISWLSLFAVGSICPDEFVLRRLTSPFLTASTLSRAWDDFHAATDATSMRAMRPASEHPMKMWERHGALVQPIGDADLYGAEVWSTPTQMLPRVYVQTAGLEILRRDILQTGSLTGAKVLPFFLDNDQGLDLNTPRDWWIADRLLAEHLVDLPPVPQTVWVCHD